MQCQPWRFNPETLVLELFNADGHSVYEVDLERCQTSAEMLDWIMQVQKKTWATDETTAALVRALHVLLRPQANLCSDGTERGPIDVAQVIARRTSYLRPTPLLAHLPPPPLD